MHWDTFGGSPTHLFLPLEQIETKRLLAKTSAKIVNLQLFNTNYKQSSYMQTSIWHLRKDMGNLASKMEIENINKHRIARLESLLFGTAKDRIKNHLSYQLGQILLKDSKSFFGISKLPFKILWTILKHKNKQKQYQEKITNNPCLKLPPLESYPDYKQALKIKNYFSYQLGEAFLTSISAGGGDFSPLSAKCVS